MSIAVLSHVPDPSIAVLRQRAAVAGRELEVHAAFRGELPAPGDHEAWVVLGGPMSAYADRSAFQPEVDVLEQAAERDVPILAICLGAQLLAVATGGRAFRGEAGLEAGLIDVHSVEPIP